MIKFTNSFLDTLNILLDLQVGDTSRLEHIKKMAQENKSLYTSDQQYVESLANTYNINHQTKSIDNSELSSPKSNCHNCQTSILKSAKYCSSCGTRQDAGKNQYKSKIKKYSQLHLHRPNSYQMLTIIGGLAVMLPALFIVARMEPLMFAINYETGRDISELAGIFIFLGILSSVLSAISITITFLIKNPKKVGRILFFMSFAILGTSILIGIAGFVLILFASNRAYKKRHY